MQTDFRLFGPLHIAILAATPALAALLSWATMRRPGLARPTRIALAIFLTLVGLSWYAYRFTVQHVRFPQGLPFELCDVSFWIAVAALVRLRQRTFELAYYWGVGGGIMALLTPAIVAPVRSFQTIEFFVGHASLVIAVLYLLWSGQARPRPRSWWFAFWAVNVYGAAIAAFNWAFQTNYLYLCYKPPTASLFDVMGPWPWYVVWAEPAALLVFLIMSAPFGIVGARSPALAAAQRGLNPPGGTPAPGPF
ncbi:MAG TPA: TIGR02206 family membrane protein [Clostridia bacterium]|nr:TIGR02206 family membrane protein [Clostridia bacterium]